MENQLLVEYEAFFQTPILGYGARPSVSMMLDFIFPLPSIFRFFFEALFLVRICFSCSFEFLLGRFFIGKFSSLLSFSFKSSRVREEGKCVWFLFKQVVILSRGASSAAIKGKTLLDHHRASMEA